MIVYIIFLVAVVFLVIGMALAVQLIKPFSHYPPCYPPPSQETENKSDLVSNFPILLLMIAIIYTLFSPTHRVEEKYHRNSVPLQKKTQYRTSKKRFFIELTSSKNRASVKSVANRFRQPTRIITQGDYYKLITEIGFRSYQEAENYSHQQGLGGKVITN